MEKIFDNINKLPILEVLDTFGIQYAKNGTWYVLKAADGRKDTSFSVDINKNMITDFGKTWIQGWVFDFIWQYQLLYTKDEMKTNIARANTIKLFLDKGLVVQTNTQKEFTPSLKDKELLAQYDNFKLNGYKSEISSFLMTRWVPYEYIQKNSTHIWSIFKDVWYYENYYCTEFESYTDQDWKWQNKEWDKPKNVWVFMFPCYNGEWELIGMKLRRKDWKTIRGKKSLAVGKTGFIYEKDDVDTKEMILVEWETDYIIMRILWYKNVIWNLGWARSWAKIIKDVLYNTMSIICLYDNDEAGIGWMEMVQKTLNRPVLKIDFPIRENAKGHKISDVNDLYKAGYDTKKKWQELLIWAKPLNNNKQDFRWDFIFIRDDMEYYDVKYKRFQGSDKIAKFMWLTGKELFKLVSDKKIPTFEGLCYRDWGRDWYYNTLDKNTIMQYPGDVEAKLHPGLDKLFYNICWGKKKNMNWLHWAILYKLTHLNDVTLPAVIMYGIGWSWKGTFIRLLSKIFWEENTMFNLKQRDLESSFDSYQWEKLIVEFQEIISWNTMQDKKILDRIKSIVWEPTITVNAKFQNARPVDNIAWFHFSSNHSVPIQLDSKHSWNRRFTIIKTLGKLNEKLAEEVNNEVIRNPKAIEEYVAWLYENFSEVTEMTSYPALDNDEKKNLEESCESAANQFFEWFETKYPYIYKLSVKQKNILLTQYCSETWEDEYDAKFKQKNFDLGLSHRYEKKRIRFNKSNTIWYFIHKSSDELENIKNQEKWTKYVIEFKDKELFNLDWVTI